MTTTQVNKIIYTGTGTEIAEENKTSINQERLRLMNNVDILLRETRETRENRNHVHTDMLCFRDFLRNNDTNIYSHLNFIDERGVGSMTGDMQTAKTNSMIYIAFHNALSNNISTVQIIKQLAGVNDYRQSLNTVNKKYKTYAKSCGIQNPFQLQILSVNTLQEDKNNNIIDSKSISNSLKKEGTKFLILSIAHTVQLNRLSKLFATCANSIDFIKPFGIWDESHLTIHPGNTKLKETPKKGNDITKWGRLSLQKCVSTLMKFCDRKLLVTATPAANYFDENAKVEYVIVVAHPPGYRSLLDCVYECIKPYNGDPVNDPCLHEWIQRLSMLSRFNSDKYNAKKDHPVNALVQVSRLTKDQEAICDLIHTKYPDKYSTITHNVKGLHIKFDTKTSNYLRQEKGGNVTVVNSCNKTETRRLTPANTVIFDTDAACLPGVYQIFDNMPAEIVERIILISGDKLKEGCRVANTKWGLALTHQFIRHQGDMANGSQKMRAVGIRHNSIPVEITCTKSMQSDLISNYHLTHEMRQKLVETLNVTTLSSQTQALRSAYNVLSHSVAQHSKFPKRQMCSFNLPIKHVKDEEPDSFVLTSIDYKKDIRRSETCTSRTKRNTRKIKRRAARQLDEQVEKKHKQKESQERIQGDEKNGGEDDNRNGLIQMKNAYNKKGKVYKIISAFVSGDYVSLDTSKLQTICGGSFVSTHFTKWDLSSRKYYKILEKASYNHYNVPHVVLEYLKLL
jgi:hypothetical protein